MKKYLLLFTILLSVGILFSGCDNGCDGEDPGVVLVNNGTGKADIQVKTSGGNTENINNILVGERSERRTFAPGDIEFTITIQGVTNNILYTLSTTTCYDYTVIINQDNSITFDSTPRD